MVTNIRDLLIRDDVIVSIAGTVVSIREDEFLLQDSTGQIWVEPARPGLGLGNLTIGEQVTVTGDRDDLEDFDAIRIIRADGSDVIGQPQPSNPVPSNPVQPTPSENIRNPGTIPLVNIADLQIRDDVLVKIRGTVVALREDEFLLRDRTGSVWVEPARGNLAIGEQVTVIGDFDDAADFDARRIIRSDGQRFNGTNQADRFTGTSWNDSLDGNGGADILNGRAGDDGLVGGQGSDRLTGGAGQDQLIYESLRCAGDVMTDFTPTADLIDLSQIFNQSRYRSANPFADYVQLQQTTRGTEVRLDPDGDLGNAGFRTLVTFLGVNVNAINANHFVV